jgi:hypothetical protein
MLLSFDESVRKPEASGLKGLLSSVEDASGTRELAATKDL